jgi:hypothetical protein
LNDRDYVIKGSNEYKVNLMFAGLRRLAGRIKKSFVKRGSYRG